jgi:uncharacterized damage-inducible protein DinB
MKSYLNRLYQHVAWADSRILECLEGAPESRGLPLFAHLLAAEQVWLARLRQEDSSTLPIWPRLSLEECAALVQQNRAEFDRYLDAVPDEALTRTVTYINSTGAEFTTSVLDILTHVALHGAYHRGQIASAVRASGAQPVNTDFVSFVRQEGSSAPIHPKQAIAGDVRPASVPE